MKSAVNKLRSITYRMLFSRAQCT